jgi:hypothetical protein
MAPDDSQAPNPTEPRGCRFTLLGIFLVTTVVAVIAAAATGAFGETVSNLTRRLFVVAPVIVLTILVVTFVFWPLAAFALKLELSLLRRRQRSLGRATRPKSPRKKATST